MKIIMSYLLIILLMITMVSGHSGHPEHTNFEQAEAIVNAEIPCTQLSEGQLEIIGDYFMEQMHPGDAHEQMDEMMGGEGSEALKQTHIRLANQFYCGNEESVAADMMGDSGLPTGHTAMMYGYGWGSSWLPYVIVIAFLFGISFWVMAKKYEEGRR